MSRDLVMSHAESFLGVPYAFGQRSAYAMDCVGFLYQISLKMDWAIDYPYDYNDPAQFQITATLDKYFKSRDFAEKADILVIRNQLGNTHHVALFRDDSYIIHSLDTLNKPGVRIDPLRKFRHNIVKIYDIASFRQI